MQEGARCRRRIWQSLSLPWAAFPSAPPPAGVSSEAGDAASSPSGIGTSPACKRMRRPDTYERNTLQRELSESNTHLLFPIIFSVTASLPNEAFRAHGTFDYSIIRCFKTSTGVVGFTFAKEPHTYGVPVPWRKSLCCCCFCARELPLRFNIALLRTSEHPPTSR